MSDDPGEELLAVAREIIEKKGYLGLSMRTVAAAAGVTPEVARRYYRNRDSLFAAALRLPADPASAIPTLVGPGIEGMGERLVRFTLDVLKDPQARADLMSLARTGVSAGHAAIGLPEFLERGVVDRVATAIGVPDARMRSALITSYLLGISMTRYVIHLEPLASASEEEVIRMVAPVVQDLIDPRKPIPGSARARAAGQAARVAAPRAATPRAATPRAATPRATTPRAGAQVPPPPPPPSPPSHQFDPDPSRSSTSPAELLGMGAATLGVSALRVAAGAVRATSAVASAALSTPPSAAPAGDARSGGPSSAGRPKAATKKAATRPGGAVAPQPTAPASGHPRGREAEPTAAGVGAAEPPPRGSTTGRATPTRSRSGAPAPEGSPKQDAVRPRKSAAATAPKRAARASSPGPNVATGRQPAPGGDAAGAEGPGQVAATPAGPSTSKPRASTARAEAAPVEAPAVPTPTRRTRRPTNAAARAARPRSAEASAPREPTVDDLATGETVTAHEEAAEFARDGD